MAHYSDVIMTTMASQITSLTSVYSTVYLRRRSKKHQSSTGLRAGKFPVTSEFPAQRASNAENVSIWWRHYGLHEYHSISTQTLNIPRDIFVLYKFIEWRYGRWLKCIYMYINIPKHVHRYWQLCVFLFLRNPDVSYGHDLFQIVTCFETWT